MKASELRIGNLVMCPAHRMDGKFVTEVKSISERYADFNGKWQPVYQINWQFHETGSEYGFVIEDVVEGIPLTEEWLLRFGFEKATNGNQSFHLFAYYVEYNGFFIEGPDECIATVDFVHQLQNLYFALTGEELQIKEEL